MKHPILALIAIFVVLAAIAAAGPQKRKHTAAVSAAASSGEKDAQAKQENQFVTVEEFVKSHRPRGTGVSVEGYAVIVCGASNGGLRISIVDSVDHVLSATDANNFAHGGAVSLITPTGLKKHPKWSWSAGMKKLAMYTGPGVAQTALHDVVTKIRLTGWASSVGTINPVTKVEYQDENGDWKTL
jgi:hypothetical protein